MTGRLQAMYSLSHKMKKRRKRRLFFTAISLFALVAVGGLLVSKGAVSLQGVRGFVQSVSVGKSSLSLPVEAVEHAAVRGTIYDRNFRELAVSYKFFSLYAGPARISNHLETAEKLAPLTGKSSQELLDLFKKPKRVVRLADNLVPGQAQIIKALSIDGLYIKGFEKRFYPQYSSAAHVVGYVSDGIGLSGMERQFDLLLQAGEYQTSMVSDLDSQGYAVLGGKGTDLVLTLDIGLQKKVDRYLSNIMVERNAEQAMGILLDPRTGRVLSLSSLPSFDGNHFWNASEVQRENRVFSPVLSKELIRPILTRAAAIMKNDIHRELLLPATVAVPDFGLDKDSVSMITKELGFRKPVFGGVLPERKVAGKVYERGDDDLISLAEIGVGLASLVNGGWRIAPVFLDYVYDLEKKKSFSLNQQAVSRRLVVSPVMGVVLRRQLLSSIEENGMVSFTGSNTRVVPAGLFSRYIQQEFFGGLVRGENGESLLLLIAVEKNNLAPFARQDGEKEKKSLKEHGRSLLADLYIVDKRENVAARPVSRNKDNKERFLISMKMEDVTPVVETERLLLEMPLVVGSSLREGLQALSQHNCRVVVKGSGRIISQYPLPRQRLQEGGECILSLEVNI